MKVTRFHHVSVNSNGRPLDEMVEFYRRGARPRRPAAPRDSRGPGSLAHGRRSRAAPRGRTALGSGIDPTGHHYCVAVDDLDAAIAELEARGIEYVRAVQGESTVQIWITDPAGNTIELQQETRVQ